MIRYATNALGSIGDPRSQIALCRLLKNDREDWGEADDWGWPVRYLVHVNAAMALARLGAKAADSEAEIASLLDHPFGQVGIFLAQALQQIGTPGAFKAVLRDLNFRRWDASLHEKQRW